ncbi:MAG: class I SAM-dependent methyltransferase [Candidatus Pacebacteria bacterium]|jgi:hypothetical protein|nr:class I SAM-dependent methyltransferase [Candidatus Paceibacterota bacterium]MBT6756065.1 class I SAM-dependent methyltransferase [Candidatus Paceibacterota bacterium]
MINKKIKQPCKLCKNNAGFIFDKKIMNKYLSSYYECKKCKFIQTEKPYWLKEAYENPINDEDTGLIRRNFGMSKISSIVIFFWFNKRGLFLDYAGGYGLLTRLMRDIGFNYYWTDPFCLNIFSPGFELTKKNKKIELVTAFELFEHMENPIKDLEKILKHSKNILFSTKLIPKNTINISKWDYLYPEHGQHISFYSQESLENLAKKYKLNYYTDGVMIHLFTEKKISKILFSNIPRFKDILYFFSKIGLSSKTHEDNIRIGKK